MKSSTNRALVAKKQSTSFAQVANNQSISLSSALRANTPPIKGQTTSRKFLTLSIFFLLSFFTTNAWGAEYETPFTITSDSVVSNSGYTKYTYDDASSRGWIITYGGNNKSVGTNEKNRTSCILTNYSKYAVSPVETTSIASAFVSTTSLTDIGKISYTFNGGSNQTSTNVYLIYSSDNNTFSQISLSTGTQGATISSGTSYTFAKKTGYFGLLFVATNSSGNWRIDDVNISFYKEKESTPTLTATPTSLAFGTVEKGSSVTAKTFSISGSNLTNGALTITAPTGYTVSPLSIPVNGTLSATTITVTPNTSTIGAFDNNITISGGGLTSSVTVALTMTVKEKYTVTLDAGPGTCAASITEASAGEGVTLPTPTLDGCGDWEFAGWKTTSAVTTETTTEPTLIPAGKYMPSDDITLYAVYQRTETTSGGGGGGTETVEDKLTYTGIGLGIASSGSATYTNFSDKTFTSDAVYKGNINKFNSSSSPTNVIQLRSNSSNSGIVTTTSGGKAKKVTVVWNSSTVDGRTLVIYGKNSAYTAATDLYSTSTSTQGTELGKIVYGTSTKLIISGDYEYIGLRSNSGAMYLTSISIDWATTTGGGSTTYYHSTPDCPDPCDALQAPNVTATATANSITLSWEAVDGATSYSVYNYTTEEAEVVNVLTYTFNGLDPETEYEWEVEAVSATCNGKGTKGTTTSATPCEKLGAATGLTVVTDFVQDGQTYVKFSWTPADNTKNYAASQKLCFGKVDEAGKCVDDLEKILTWTGDLKSKLEPGEYWWSIQALGDGVNYCDGDVVNGTNFTIEAPTYTVEWFVNGEEAKGTPTTSVTAGQKVTVLPTTPTSADCDDNKVFVGWTDTEIDGTSANAPTNLYKELGDFPAINANTIYYAVFATAEGVASTDYAQITNSNNLTDGKYVIAYGYNTTTPSIILKAATKNEGTTLVATSASPSSNKYQNPAAENIWSIKKNGTTYTLYNDATSKYVQANTTPALLLADANPTNFNIEYSTDHWKIKINDNTSYQLVGYTNASGNYFQTKSGASASYKIQLYKNTSTVSYSDYSTTCVKLPDPELSFATEPADPIVFTDAVCGGNSSKQSVTVVGENLRDVVNVSVTGPYKIARTSSTALKDFTTSLTLDKTAAGAIHSNYKTVYIISTPPAQSTEATTGTLTFTTTKGNTLTVNLSTPTVTCTQYTLTLVDRGVSTEQPTKYYAGEKINEAPADPEGVCTDPIHYVFDGWAEATVAADATTYDKVTFPYTVEGNTKFYAVYRYLEDGGADSGDYVKVTENLDDYSGDYLFVYEEGNVAFDGGRNNVDEELDAPNNTIEVTINGNTIESNATTDAAKFTIAKVDGGYSIQSASGYYIGWSTADGNGLNANSKYSANYYLNTISNSIISGVKDTLKYNKTSGQERFRYYKSGQEDIALYRKAASYLYTTSPICGPHLAITEGKEIYVTGGNAGGTRDLVIAQKKVSYKATRLKTSNGLTDGTAPDVKVATNGITVGGVVTSDVKVTIDQTKEQQTDGTYTITGTITVQYQPSANNKQEDIQVQLAVDYNSEAKDNFTVHARSLPEKFVIVAKSGDKWYALNGDMNTNAANPANGQVTLDDPDNPTEATYAPCNTIYTFDGVPNTGDRTYVRFQGTDGAWLWSSSGTNVGIQNNVLKTTPEGNNKAYNWKLYTQDNITYRFSNANSSRQLTLSGEKFGMYASGVQDIRILPYEAKCLYNYAPTNLKVSVLKGTYVTLTWDAVAGATKYQYSTDATNWNDAGTEPTATINGLTGDTEYTYYIRAYHEDAGVSQECIDYAEITFTTANCDDVPSNITYTADLSSITVSWTAAAPTATITYNTKEDGTGGGGIINNATSPYKISGGLKKNTTYYIQILADGTCASPIIPVKTEDVEVDIVEWYPQGIIVDINTDETVGVTLENEVSYGSGMGTEATELFFSKYYEATTNVKLVAIYNGTKNIIDLTDYEIHYGKTPEKGWETNYITLKDFGEIKGQIQPGEELILYTMSDSDNSDKQIMNCVNAQYPNGKWVRVTQANNTGKGSLSFAGDKTIVLKKAGTIIDIIGAINSNGLPNNAAVTRPSWGDANGWTCATGLSIADDSQIGISTNRCLLIRNNTVTSGDNAVTQNINDFVTLCTEWKGAHVPDSDIDNGVQASCDNFAYVGTFDYSDYYTKYVPMGEGTTFDENDRNDDGTVTIPITDLYKHACSNIRVKLTNSNSEVLTDREYKVPIMITTTQGTDGQAFLDLQQNLATKEVDGEGNVINTYPLSLDEVREICKTCDVVVRDNATLTKVTDGTTNDHPQVRNVYVYEGASIVIPDGVNHNYTINGLSLRRKGDEVASAQVQGTGKFVLPADESVCLDLRVDANNWHWFTLPYDCDIADVTWIDGTPAKYNTDWFLMYYDGESRAASTNPYDNHWKVYSGTTIEAGKGYIVGITGDLTHPNYTFELRFPMAQGVLTGEQTDKTVPVNAWGVKSDNTPNNLGWNLVGNPYLNYYKTADDYSPLAGLPLIHYTNTDPVTGEWYYENSGSVPYVATPIDGGWYEYRQELASEVNMMPFTAYFVQVGDPETHTNGQALNASFEASNRGKKSIVRRAPREVEEIEEPIIVRVELTNSKGESDKTSLVIDDRFTNEYEMNGDFFKWFGDYYNYYTKPVLYTIGADQGKRAFNALNEELAKQPIPMGMYAAQAGNYTFSLNQQFDLSRVEEVWLYDATQSTYTNLMQSDYTFSTSKVNGAGRFSLSVKLAPKVATSIDNVTADKVWATTHTKQIIVNGLESGMHLWLYDATGKLLYNEPTSNYQHTYSVPQTGTYFVSVMKGNAKQTIKVVVE